MTLPKDLWASFLLISILSEVPGEIQLKAPYFAWWAILKKLFLGGRSEAWIITYSEVWGQPVSSRINSNHRMYWTLTMCQGPRSPFSLDWLLQSLNFSWAEVLPILGNRLENQELEDRAKWIRRGFATPTEFWLFHCTLERWSVAQSCTTLLL